MGGIIGGIIIRGYRGKKKRGRKGGVGGEEKGKGLNKQLNIV